MERINLLKQLIKDNNAYFYVMSSKSSIFYYTGIDCEDVLVVVSLDDVRVLTDSRYITQFSRLKNKFNIVDCEGKFTSYILNHYKGKKMLYDSFMNVTMYKVLANNFENSLLNIDYLRVIKDENEIKKIKKACKIASDCYKYILGYIKPNMKEKEISLEMQRYMILHGASKESFPTIVASGKRGALPHGIASSKIIKNNEFITLDFGCVYKGYCSDITRSFMIGKANKELIKIYKIVLSAQKEAIKAIKDGVKASDIDLIARNYIDSKGYGKYFIHSTGHGVGIDVHEVIRVSSSSDDILKENMIVTVEPGIYIPGLGGIRIEDDVLVTKNGAIVLTKASKRLISIK